MKCRVCESKLGRETVDNWLLLGFSFNRVMEEVNPERVALGERPLKLKHLSWHKNRCLLPLSPENQKMMRDMGVELVRNQFVNPSLMNKTIFRKDA